MTPFRGTSPWDRYAALRYPTTNVRIGRRVTGSNSKCCLSADRQGTSGRGSGLVKPLRFGISTLGSEAASRTVSSVTTLFR